jgi:hypothetical protein
MLNATFKSVRTVVAVAALMLVATAAHAGPPLICHPFQTGQTSLLPWANAPGWNTPDPSYDVTRLVADTTRLLAPETPVLARMETNCSPPFLAAHSQHKRRGRPIPCRC